MTYRQLVGLLQPLYGIHEARAISRLVYGSVAGLSLTDICAGADERLSQADQEAVETASRRLLAGEPVQYVLGKTEFAGREFIVGRGVLIPRPETEQLCSWIAGQSASYGSILDVGTGSGCIAITLSMALPGAYVEGWDNSNEALAVATENALLHHSAVVLRHRDIFSHRHKGETWDAIVSNPPYIPMREREEMEDNVLLFEPHEALFVPDDDPLVYYREIARYAAVALNDGGWLFFETHHLYNPAVARMLRGMGFADVECCTDDFGKPRMIRARKTAV